MKITIEMRDPRLDAQGMKEAVAMRLEGLAEEIHVTEIRQDVRQASLWEGADG